MPEIVPSILSADFARLAEDIARVEQGGVSMLHVDIMDGHFVPNITIGPPVLKSIRKATKLTLDVHLMITNPDLYIGPFVEAGADQISVQQEACVHLDRTLRLIQSEGALAGVVLNPSTPVTMLEDVLEIADFVLLMSVNPGFGGQRLIPRVLHKARTLATKRTEAGLRFPIEIDGGVNLENLAEVVRSGVDWVVTGASVFLTPDPAATVVQMRRIAEEAAGIRV